MTKTIATLGPEIRLVVFKFLLKSVALVPDCIPRLSVIKQGITPVLRGREILQSTPDVSLEHLQMHLLNDPDYILVGARANKRIDGKYDVRFTFCHIQYLNDTPAHPVFTARFEQLINVFIDFRKSIWTTMAHLNSYLSEDGSSGKGSVLMWDCNGRRKAVNLDGSPVTVYEGGRQKPFGLGFVGQGIGPKVSLMDKASHLKLIDKKVQMVMP